MPISPFIERQLPSHVRRDYPLFVTFLKTYYEYLEEIDYPVTVIEKLDGVRNLTKNPDMADRLASEIFYALPGVTVADKSQLLFRSQEYFRSKGTEDSLKFIFRAIFGTDIVVTYPGEDLLIASGGNWKTGTYIEVEGTVPVTASVITQVGTGASADIIDRVIYSDVTTIEVADLIPDTLVNATLIETDVILVTSVNPAIDASAVIELDGFATVNPVTYPSFSLDLTTYDSTIEQVEVYGTVTGDWVGTTATDGSYEAPETFSAIRVTFLGHSIAIRSVGLRRATYTRLELSGIGGTEFDTSDVTISGTTYDVKAGVETVSGYVNQKHHVSGRAKIFDGYFRSSYSYLIQGASRVNIEETGRTIRELFHPEGLEGFLEFEDNFITALDVPLIYSLDRSYTFMLFSVDREEWLTNPYLSFAHNRGSNGSVRVRFRDVFGNIMQTETFTQGSHDLVTPLEAKTVELALIVTASAGNALKFSQFVFCEKSYLDTLDAEYHAVIR